MMTPAIKRQVSVLLDAAKPLPRRASLLWLLLFKRICDRWEEEREAHGPHAGEHILPSHRIIVPARCSWDELRRHSQEVGAALNAAFHAVEEANPTLGGMISWMDFNDRESFPPSVLRELFSGVDAIRMRQSDMDDEAFGAMCEALEEGAAADAGGPGPESRTPRHVARLLVELLQPREGMSIYDGTCGSGRILLECCRYMSSLGRSHGTLRLYGQEIEADSWALCRINLACHGIQGASIEKGDTLRAPRHLTGDGRTLMTFDRVMSHPPFRRKDWGFEEWSPADRFGRSEYGIPPKSCADFAFVEHFVSSLSQNGMLGLVAPQGMQFRGREEGAIRQRMLQDDLFEAVINLGHSAWSPFPMPACILILNKAKSRERRGTMLLVDSDRVSRVTGCSDGAPEEVITRITSAFHDWKDQEHFCRVVSLEDVKRAGYVLNVSRCLDAGGEEAQGDVAVEWRTLQTLIAERNEAERKMAEQIRHLEDIRDES